MTARTSGGLYPELPRAEPSAPPSDEGFGGSSGASVSSGESRGILRPHSVSPPVIVDEVLDEFADPTAEDAALPNYDNMSRN